MLPDFKDISSKQQADHLGWPHLNHYRNVVRRFQHMQGSNALSQSSSFIMTSVSPRRFQFITSSTRFFLQDPGPVGHAATSLIVEDDKTVASQTLGSEDEKLNGIGNNIVKVTSRYGIEATLSPLVLHAVRILLPSWHENTVCGSN